MQQLSSHRLYLLTLKECEKRSVTCSNILFRTTYTKYKLPLIQNLKWASIQLLTVTRVGTYWQHMGASKPKTRTPITLKLNQRILIMITIPSNSRLVFFNLGQSAERELSSQLKAAPCSYLKRMQHSINKLHHRNVRNEMLNLSNWAGDNLPPGTLLFWQTANGGREKKNTWYIYFMGHLPSLCGWPVNSDVLLGHAINVSNQT